MAAQAGDESDLRAQLRPQRAGRALVPRGEPADPPAGRADALRRRSAHAAAAGAARTVCRRLDRAGGSRGADLDGASAADGIRDVHDPAVRIADGPLLPAHPLWPGPRRLERKALAMVRRRHRRLRLGHGRERSHGHRAGHGAALRSRVPVRLIPRSVPPEGFLLSGPGGDVAGSRRDPPAVPSVRRRGLRAGDRGVGIRAYAAGSDPALPAAELLAERAVLRLLLADRDERLADRPGGGRHRGAAGRDAVGAAPRACARVSRRVVLPGPGAELELPADRDGGRRRASDVSAAGGRRCGGCVRGVLARRTIRPPRGRIRRDAETPRKSPGGCGALVGHGRIGLSDVRAEHGLPRRDLHLAGYGSQAAREREGIEQSRLCLFRDGPRRHGVPLFRQGH